MTPAEVLSVKTQINTLRTRLRPLRVAVLALSARSYGGDSYIRAFIPALQRYGKDIEVTLIVQDDRYNDLCTPTGNCRYLKVGHGAALSGVKRVLWEQTLLRRLVSEIGVDVLYTTNNTTVFNSPVPVVIAVRNMEPLTPCADGVPHAHALRHFLLSKLTYWSAKHARRIMAVSNYVRDTLVSLGIPRDKCDVVYHGVDDVQESNLIREAHASFGYVFSMAKFVRYANLETLFRGFKVLREKGYRGELRFAGGSYDAGYEAEIRALIESLKITEAVKFLGYIPRTQTQKELRQCDAFLFSSTLEACPFSLLEGMSQGAPIVATTANPMPEFCGDAALFVAPTDAQAFGEEAFKIISDQVFANDLRSKALARAAEFTWERTVENTVSCWEKATCES